MLLKCRLTESLPASNPARNHSQGEALPPRTVEAPRDPVSLPCWFLTAACHWPLHHLLGLCGVSGLASGLQERVALDGGGPAPADLRTWGSETVPVALTKVPGTATQP